MAVVGLDLVIGLSIAKFFPAWSKLWNSAFKMLNFQNIQQLISLSMHLNKTIIRSELNFLPKHFFSNIYYSKQY